MSTDFSKILQTVDQYYTKALKTYNATPRGVDWNSTESQLLRFEQLLRVCDPCTNFSIDDYGCGYGALVDYLTSTNYAFTYQGFDISESMITKAKELYGDLNHCYFVSKESLLSKADYTLASGVFNVKLRRTENEWQNYVLHVLGKLAALSRKGFAFNLLTKYSDPDRMRPELYYADPCFIFDYCKTNFSRHVALLHDYGLFEFTILVKLDRS